MPTKWDLTTNRDAGAYRVKTREDPNVKGVVWMTLPVDILPPKPRRNNGPINWRGIPVWLLSKVFRWQ